jgi:hypothetical protein
LGAALARLSKSLGSVGAVTATGAKAISKRRLKLSPARQRALKLHGRYLGYIRQLRPRQRAEVKALREKKGVEAAIKRARMLAGR